MFVPFIQNHPLSVGELKDVLETDSSPLAGATHQPLFSNLQAIDLSRHSPGFAFLGLSDTNMAEIFELPD
jgi:hypothetical protein